MASAMDDGLVNLYVPAEFPRELGAFRGTDAPPVYERLAEFAALKARELATAVVQPDAFTADISYAWEGLGPAALPFITPLLTHPSQKVQFAAARAAAVSR